jgi:hypothetical protein
MSEPTTLTVDARSDLFTPEQIAKDLQVSVKEVWRYMGEGLPFIILSPRKRRIPADGYESWKQYRTITQNEKGRVARGQADGKREASELLRGNQRGSRTESGSGAGDTISARDALAAAMGGKRLPAKGGEPK